MCWDWQIHLYKFYLNFKAFWAPNPKCLWYYIHVYVCLCWNGIISRYNYLHIFMFIEGLVQDMILDYVCYFFYVYCLNKLPPLNKEFIIIIIIHGRCKSITIFMFIRDYILLPSLCQKSTSPKNIYYFMVGIISFWIKSWYTVFSS
jgi:hypothetical protein